ncbi:MAG: hypothetical protein H5T45_01560 [Thermoplasmatales archaeon]|nr:hypothetical protein [Thermoplasmatales archaeon]
MNEKIITIAKNIFRKEGKEMYDYQIDILKQFCGGENVIINKSRQVGISDLLACWGLLNSLLLDKTTLIISPSERQSKHLMEYIYNHLHTLENDFIIQKQEETKSSIVFSKGAIYSLPSNPKTIRGFSADLIIFDEFAHFPYGLDKEIWQAASPSISRGGQLIICSTPFSKRNLFYDFWQNGHFKKITINYRQCKHLNNIEEIRKNIDEETFAQEFDNVFLDEEKEQEFSEELIRKCIDVEIDEKLTNGIYLAGVDIGRHKDFTALAIIKREGDKFKLVKYEIIKNKTFEEQEKILSYYFSNFKFESIMIDATGIGAMLAERLAGKYAAKAITFTNELKEKLVLNLKLLMQQGKFFIMDDAFVISSFRAIRRKYTENNILKFESDRSEELGHADLFWAIALALNFKKSNLPKIVEKTRW